MDERVHLIRRVGGGSFFLVHQTTVDELGQAGLEAELTERGFSPEDLGPAKFVPGPTRHREAWKIPVRRSPQD